MADTKFEFGLDEDGELLLIDEVFTPDSSRFWPAATYAPGRSPESFDKQFVRDYLETLDWDKKPPGPRLPERVIRRDAGQVPGRAAEIDSLRLTRIPSRALRNVRHERLHPSPATDGRRSATRLSVAHVGTPSRGSRVEICSLSVWNRQKFSLFIS